MSIITLNIFLLINLFREKMLLNLSELLPPGRPIRTHASTRTHHVGPTILHSRASVRRNRPPSHISNRTHNHVHYTITFVAPAKIGEHTSCIPCRQAPTLLLPTTRCNTRWEEERCNIRSTSETFQNNSCNIRLKAVENMLLKQLKTHFKTIATIHKHMNKNTRNIWKHSKTCCCNMPLKQLQHPPIYFCNIHMLQLQHTSELSETIEICNCNIVWRERS